MAKLKYFMLFGVVILTQCAWPAAGWLGSTGITNVKTLDGATVCGTPTGLKVSNGTLTCNSDGTATVTTGGGGGGGISGSIASTQVAYGTGTDTIGGSSLFTFNSSTGAVSATAFITAASNTPQVNLYSATPGDTNWGIVNLGDGAGNNNDPLYIYEGTDITASHRLTIVPGGALSTASTVTPGGNLIMGTNSITMTGSLAATGARVTKGWFTDIESTNAPTVGGVGIPTASSTTTFTNKRITPRDVTVTQSATPVINTDNTDHAHITGLAQAITSMTSSLSGTPNAGETLWIDITDNGTARAITWGASFEASTVALPVTTVISTRLDIGFVWNEITLKWRCVAAS